MAGAVPDESGFTGFGAGFLTAFFFSLMALRSFALSAIWRNLGGDNTVALSVGLPRFSFFFFFSRLFLFCFISAVE